MQERRTATAQQISDLQSTLMAAVLCLDSLPNGNTMTMEQFKEVRRVVYELVYQTLPGGAAEPGKERGMCAGWLQMGEQHQFDEHGYHEHTEVILERLLGMTPKEFLSRGGR